MSGKHDEGHEIPDSMRRRDFLATASRAALGLAGTSLVGCRGRKAPSADRPPPATSEPGEVVAELEERIPGWMQETATPGVSIAIIQAAKVAWRRAFGVKDAASTTPVDPDTMFEAASMSKPVFAYVVMKLCETGLMDLDTPLTRYASDRILEGDPRLDLVTARHVLSHTAGFQNWRSEKTPLAIHFTPGEKFLYSGEGYHYLQTVVTGLIGQPFETFMSARLLAPFGMTSSGYVWTDVFARRMARPHDASGKPIDNKKSSPEDVARYGSAGAMLSTPTDYAKFMIEVIAPKPSDANRLTRESVAEMLRSHVKIESNQYPASWALGWQIFHNNGRDFIYHGGDNEGFHCASVASVEGRSGLVVMTNGEAGTSVLRNIILSDRVQRFLAA
ncbi:MAG: serine hydrolase [Geminicoccaceae bacterium]|nr:serine hydrolase [Geminicoccaceae bacterium]